jgi:hypothetical protein
MSTMNSINEDLFTQKLFPHEWLVLHAVPNPCSLECEEQSGRSHHPDAKLGSGSSTLTPMSPFDSEAQPNQSSLDACQDCYVLPQLQDFRKVTYGGVTSPRALPGHQDHSITVHRRLMHRAEIQCCFTREFVMVACCIFEIRNSS